jgi:eukaryotic-like serine/threonine-protein kinase
MTDGPSDIGNYTLEKLIGSGMVSEVWLARHHLLEDRLVAIKLLTKDDPEWVERFQREARIASRLIHSHIVRILDHGHEGRRHYTVMEYVRGVSLRAALQPGHALPLDRALDIFCATGAALDYADTRGVIHRDVSPNNILLEEGTDRVVLTDFGIARDTGEPTHTTFTQSIGTRGYLSPEHSESLTKVTHLSDLYALGIVLYEMIAGARPWRVTPGHSEDGRFVSFGPPLPLRERGVTGIAANLDRVFESLLAVEPAKRYPSAQAAAEEIARIVASEAPTQIFGGATRFVSAGARPGSGAAYAVPVIQPWSQEPHPVEEILGPHLLKKPLHEASNMARGLSEQATLIALLDQCGHDGFLGGVFRRRGLGRQASFSQVRSTNLYFYHLTVLYEVRTAPVVVEEPDLGGQPHKVEPEPDRWAIELTPVTGFGAASGGSLRVPGTTRARGCESCHGTKMIVCPRCHGTRWIEDTRGSRPGDTANARRGLFRWIGPQADSEVVPVECPDCDGAGGSVCTRCRGTGRMVKYKTITWRRWPNVLEQHDELPAIRESWLRRNCEPKLVYRECHHGAGRPEWQLVPRLGELLERARQRLDGDTRIVRSEATISFVPISEVTFGLGDTAGTVAANGQGPERLLAIRTRRHTWFVCGFERKIPWSWTLVNRDRALALVFAVALLVAVVLGGIGRW